MRTMFAIAALCCPVMAMAQITSSDNLGCTIVAQGGVFCNGLSAVPSKPSAVKPNEEGKKGPTLLLWNITLEPGASFERPYARADYALLGINGGELLNEKTPFLHVSLDKDSVTLMPREQPFRLRNNSSQSVKFRVIEIQR